MDYFVGTLNQLKMCPFICVFTQFFTSSSPVYVTESVGRKKKKEHG